MRSEQDIVSATEGKTTCSELLRLSLIYITIGYIKRVTYSVKFTGATLISGFAIGVKFIGGNAVPGHARHLGHRYSPAGYEPKYTADLSE